MGFSIWVADDPELKYDEDDPDTWQYKEQGSGYPYFSCSLSGIDFLRREMIAQKMVSQTRGYYSRAKLIPLGAFVFNDGVLVSGAQIRTGLARAKRKSLLAKNADTRKFWREWLDFLHAAEDHGGIRVY